MEAMNKCTCNQQMHPLCFLRAFLCLSTQLDIIKLQQSSIAYAFIIFLQIFEFIIQKFYALRKPKTNIQILQQSVLKYKYANSLALIFIFHF